MTDWPWDINDYGDCIVELHNIGTERECLVVTRADQRVRATVELVREWRDGSSRVTLDGDVVRFGTEGEGLGVVAYKLGETRLSDEWVQMWRVA